MPLVQPFIFDTAFDSDIDEREAAARAKREAELDAARREAYERGVRDGRQAAESDLAGLTLAAVTDLAPRIATLIAEQEQQNAVARQGAVRVAVEIVKKLYPHFERRHGLDEIEGLVRACFEELGAEPRLVVRVGPELAAPLKERIDELAVKAGYPGRVVLVPADDLNGAEARVEWADGGVTRDPDRLWDVINRLVEKALAEPVPPSLESEPTD